MYKKLQKNQTMFICPFCKKEIVASKKSEIYYRNHWTNGCIECFLLSISGSTTAEFQVKNY